MSSWCLRTFAQILLDFIESIGSVITRPVLQHFHRTAKHSTFKSSGANRSALTVFELVSQLRQSPGENSRIQN
jgi:hypothetical protein